MPKSKTLAFYLAISFSSLLHAGPQLPVQEVNLAVLDLNGTPFRHFHLNHYQGAVLNPVTVTPAPVEDVSAHGLMMREMVGESLDKAHDRIAMQAPEQTIFDLDALMIKKRRRPW